MKRVLLIVFILLLVGCSQETTQEKEPEKVYNNTLVNIDPLRTNGKTINQLLEEDSSYLKILFGEIYEIHNEQQLAELIEQRIIEKESFIGVKYLGREMPTKVIEEVYERITNENDLINSTFEMFEYGFEKIKDGFFIDFKNTFLITNLLEEQTNKKINEMYASLSPQLDGLSDYEKTKKIYEFVMDHMEYTVGGTYDDHTVVGFVNGKGVCQAYAIGLYMLLDKASLEVRYIDGALKPKYQNGFPNHAWNMVKLEGKWYHLDATWDDGQVEEDWLYFLVSDTRMEASRSWNREYYEEAKGKYTVY